MKGISELNTGSFMRHASGTQSVKEPVLELVMLLY